MLSGKIYRRYAASILRLPVERNVAWANLISIETNSKHPGTLRKERYVIALICHVSPRELLDRQPEDSEHSIRIRGQSDDKNEYGQTYLLLPTSELRKKRRLSVLLTGWQKVGDYHRVILAEVLPLWDDLWARVAVKTAFTPPKSVFGSWYPVI